MTDSEAIVTAVSADDVSTHALEFALERGEQTGTPVEAVYITSTDDATASMENRTTAVAEEYGVDFTFNSIHRPESSALKSANEVGELLVEYLIDRDEDYAYLVMGNEQKNNLKKSFIGSATKEVVQSHQIPVLLVPDEVP